MAFVWLKPKKTQTRQSTNVPSPQPRPLTQRPSPQQAPQQAPAQPRATPEIQPAPQPMPPQTQQVAAEQRVIDLTFGRLVKGENYCLYYSNSELGINIDVCGPRDRIVEIVKQLAERAEKRALRGHLVLKPGQEPVGQMPVSEFKDLTFEFEDLRTKWLLVLYDARTILRELGS